MHSRSVSSVVSQQVVQRYVEHAGEAEQSAEPGCLRGAALEDAERAHADPGLVRELLLAEPALNAEDP